MEPTIYEQRRQALEEFRYLPLFYLIPDEIAVKRGLADFPRDPYIAATDEHWREVYHSKLFQVTLLDTWGWMMWQCLGIHGGIDCYSKNDPFALTALCLPMWAALLSEVGINTDLLASYPLETEIPFLSMEQAAHNCNQFAKYFWNHPALHMREVWEVVKTHRDHRDYSGIPSQVKIDFQRKYYHTRAKTQVIPDTDKDGEPVFAPYYPNDFADVETRIWFEGFLAGLSERDRQIAVLLADEYTQEEIAQMLDYANHSGVCKRISFIRKELRKYLQR
ncbi:MAG: hypothetical protein RR415_11250 [Ruthenibacterium sp.]